MAYLIKTNFKRKIKKTITSDPSLPKVEEEYKELKEPLNIVTESVETEMRRANSSSIMENFQQSWKNEN